MTSKKSKCNNGNSFDAKFAKGAKFRKVKQQQRQQQVQQQRPIQWFFSSLRMTRFLVVRAKNKSYVVMAPFEALLTELAYLKKTPRL
jgi:hypothetical protein